MITKYKCDECEAGIVKVVRKETRKEISIDVRNCDKCGKPHGFKSISNLVEVKA